MQCSTARRARVRGRNAWSEWRNEKVAHDFSVPQKPLVRIARHVPEGHREKMVNPSARIAPEYKIFLLTSHLITHTSAHTITTAKGQSVCLFAAAALVLVARDRTISARKIRSASIPPPESHPRNS